MPNVHQSEAVRQRLAGRTGMTILDLRDSPWVDGPGRTILDCAESLQEMGCRFVIGTFANVHGEESAYAAEARRRNLEVLILRESGQFDWRVFAQLLKAMKAIRVDIVHTHDLRSNVVGLLCARWYRKPVITTVHGWIANTTKRKIYRALDKGLLRFFDAIVAVSSRTKELIERAWIAGSRITVINNALKVEQYIPDRSDQSYRAELGIDEKTILVANIGRLSPEKGHLEFLQAGRELLQTHANIKLVLIGVGPEQLRLERFVSDNGMTKNVVFAGFRNDMKRVYNSLDLVVQSSYTEGMPNVVLEALLMKVPVIASDVGGTAEIIEHEKTGILIQPGQQAELVREMCDFVANPLKHKAMALLGRDVVMDRFNHQKRVKKFAALYNQLLARAGQRGD